MRRLRNILISLQAAILLTACNADSYEFSQYQCYFYFDCSIHLGTTLQSCLNSSGSFCFVWQNLTSSYNTINMQLCDKKTTSEKITTAIELKRPSVLGIDNGLIIGCSTLNNGELFVYDRTCPNCLANSQHKKVDWDNNGQWVKCPGCGRSYDLNNCGYVVSGDSGDKLMRYRATYAGTMLIVNN